jgi:hypothetical protein
MPFDRRNIPLFAAFVPLYAATYWTSDVFRLPETGSTPWNPEAGLAVAALFCLGPPRAAGAGCHPFPVPCRLGTLLHPAVDGSTGRRPHVGTCRRRNAPPRGFLVTVCARQQQRRALRRISACSDSCLGHATDVDRPCRHRLVLRQDPAFRHDRLRWQHGGHHHGVSAAHGFSPARKSPEVRLANAKWAGGLLLGFLLVTCLAVFGIQGLDQFKFFYLVFIPVMALGAARRHDGSGGGRSRGEHLHDPRARPARLQRGCGGRAAVPDDRAVGDRP